MTFEEAFNTCPLISILRDIEPNQAIPVANALFDAGFRLIEVPLNSPKPLESISLLATHFSGRAIIGAGTVLTPQAVTMVAKSGGQLVVSPHSDRALIERAMNEGIKPIPGVATITEAHEMITAGADLLKLFPAELIDPKQVASFRQVLPKHTHLIPVGGINASNMGGYLNNGASGLGFGSSLFTPQLSLDAIRSNAETIIKAWKTL